MSSHLPTCPLVNFLILAEKDPLSTSAYLSVGRPPYPGRKPSCPPLLYTQRWASWYFHLQKEKASTQISTGPIFKEWDE